MKKFLTSVFMLSMVLFSMSVFDSCKDYDEDEYNDLVLALNGLDVKNSDLKALLKADSTALKALIDAVDQAQKNCSTNCRNRMNILHDSIVMNATQISINKDSIWILANKIKDQAGQIAALQTADKALQDQDSILGAQLAAVQALLQDSTGTFINIATVIAGVDEKIQGFENQLKDLKNLTKNDSIIFAQLDNFYTKPEVDSLLNLIDTKVNTVSAAATEALQRAKNDSIWIKSLENTVSDVSKIANEALERSKNDSTKIETINGLISDLNTTVDSLKTVTKSLEDAMVQAEKNRISADSLLQNQIDALVLAMSGLTVDVADLDGRVDDLEDDLDDLDGRVDDLEDDLDDLDDKVDSLDNAYGIKIATLEDAMQTADSLLQDQIDTLAAKVQKNAEDIAAINDSIAKITGRLDKIDEALKSLITGIVIQSTVNPVFGTFSLPLGINSNVLMAFYGKAENSIVFPTKDPANFVKASQTFTDADWNMISSVSQFAKAGNSVLFNKDEGNAGTLYLTVNPGSVDFAGQTLELVNSKDEASKVVLSPLTKENDYELKFGYTRAAETNGFYSAKATLDEDDIEAVKVDIQDGLKTAFKDVLTKRTFNSVGDLALKLYSQFDGILPAQGLKASWTDYNGEHSVYSQYGIAATAFKPLSYAFMENRTVQTIPGYERAIKLVDDLAAEIKGKIPGHVAGDLENDLKNNLTIDKIEIKDLTADQLALFEVVIDTTITVKGKTYTIDPVPVNVNINAETKITEKTYNVTKDGAIVGTVTIPETTYPTTGTATGTANVNPITVDDTKVRILITRDLKDAANSLWGTVQDQLEGVNTMLDQIEVIVDDANELLDNINGRLADASAYVDNIATRVKKYIDLVNDKLATILNSANSRIQPVLLLGNSKTGLKIASRMKGNASVVMSGDVEFTLTSYTADIVVPAYKKHIAVTNVFKGGKSAQGGDANCKLALQTANGSENMNKVLNGSETSVKTTLPAGYLYEVAYSALDYSGKISMHKYYVQY